MTANKMLIDATHPEETRVVVLSGNRIEDFDVEVASRKQLKGNIYLAKVTRVEPSLQAAFVDYGGNRHGFLAFNEIHPDYYQIPVGDREVLIAEQEAAEKEDEASRTSDAEGDEDDDETDGVATLGGDVIEEVEERRTTRGVRRYKIQEVIKRRQIILVQVVKEERGNKGAALTTYISLAGRYCVLMPNTARGGGISRKITSHADRKRLRTILNELGIPGGIAVIVRTAGSERTKAEISRDYDYLLRLWDDVRERTLKSSAPCLVHEEADLIKRSIRDLYGGSIEEIIVEGEDGYRSAKDFMKLLVPSYAKRVQPYRDSAIPLFQRFQVEGQLDGMHSPQVQLKSGGYIVIDPTEALVSIDVNSGRATRGRNIEETALKTNLEASDEIARQLRLRDLSGLIVIDFIDMEISRSQKQTERRLKDAMRNDRARIQIGRISPFGLLELSRQRLRPSIIETSSEPCPHCAGTGVLRSTESAALHVLRAIEEEGIRGRGEEIVVYVPVAVALYILNQKRAALADTEGRYGFSVVIAGDDDLISPDHRIEVAKDRRPVAAAAKDKVAARTVDQEAVPAVEEEGKRRRRRRSRRRKRPEDEPRLTAAAPDQAEETEIDDKPAEEAAETEEQEAGKQGAKRRRRGKRGGRRRTRRAAPLDAGAETPPEAEAPAVQDAPRPEESGEVAPAVVEAPPEEAGDKAAEGEGAQREPAIEPRRRRPATKAAPAGKRTRRPKADVQTEAEERPGAAAAGSADEPAKPAATRAKVSDDETAEEKPKPRPRRRRKPSTAGRAEEAPKAAAGKEPRDQSPPPPPPSAPATPVDHPPAIVETGGGEAAGDETRRRGWWQRLSGQ